MRNWISQKTSFSNMRKSERHSTYLLSVYTEPVGLPSVVQKKNYQICLLDFRKCLCYHLWHQRSRRRREYIHVIYCANDGMVVSWWGAYDKYFRGLIWKVKNEFKEDTLTGDQLLERIYFKGSFYGAKDHLVQHEQPVSLLDVDRKSLILVIKVVIVTIYLIMVFRTISYEFDNNKAGWDSTARYAAMIKNLPLLSLTNLRTEQRGLRRFPAMRTVTHCYRP